MVAELAPGAESRWFSHVEKDEGVVKPEKERKLKSVRSWARHARKTEPRRQKKTEKQTNHNHATSFEQQTMTDAAELHECTAFVCARRTRAAETSALISTARNNDVPSPLLTGPRQICLAANAFTAPSRQLREGRVHSDSSHTDWAIRHFGVDRRTGGWRHCRPNAALSSPPRQGKSSCINTQAGRQAGRTDGRSVEQLQRQRQRLTQRNVAAATSHNRTMNNDDDDDDDEQ